MTMKITNDSSVVPHARAGRAYEHAIEVSGEIHEPLTWNITKGELPAGLRLVGNRITGEARERAAKVPFTVECGDSSNPPRRVSRDLSITVEE